MRSPACGRGRIRSAARMSPVSQTFPATSTCIGSSVRPTTRTRWYAWYIAGRTSVSKPASTFTNVFTGVVLTELTRVTRKPDGATRKRPGSSQSAGSYPSARTPSFQIGSSARARSSGPITVSPSSSVSPSFSFSSRTNASIFLAASS